jgi:hypothetical protein
MKKITKKIVKQSQGKPSSFSKNFIQRQKAECDLRSIKQRLHKANEWIPILKTIDLSKDPSVVLESLRRRQIDLLHKVGSMRAGKQGEPGKSCLNGLPDLFDVFDRKKFGEFVLVMRMIERLTEFNPNSSIQTVTPGVNTPQAWSTLLMSTVLDHYPNINWGDDSSAVFTTSWDFDPFRELSRGIIGHQGYVSVDPPPFYTPWADPNHAQLTNFAALAFDVPSSSFDAIVNFEANVVYAVQLAIDADDAFFYGSPMLYIQQDASTGNPVGLEDFNTVGESISIEGTVNKVEIKNSIISGNYHVNARKQSRIHIGMNWNLTVTNGGGGTIPCGWDSFIFFPPANDDTWGVRVNVVPV